jgi:probable rRNA maturation factor
MTHQVLVLDEAAYLEDLTFLSEAARIALVQQRAPAGDLTIALVSEARMKELNQEYAGEDHATDVLSFPHHEIDSESGRLYIGDVAICVSVAREQVQQAGHSLKSELLLLAVHGILHLLGYDHKSEEDSITMFSLQKDLLSKIATNEA